MVHALGSRSLPQGAGHFFIIQDVAEEPLQVGGPR